ncbi:MAG: OPT/YSL family transporter [Janthinobacterium lividum]
MADGGTVQARHPRFFSWSSLLLITPLCMLGSVVGMQVLVRLGVTTNTALIGALAAMGLGRVPVASLRRYRDIHVQNLAQSAISASTFGAANSLLLPIGIPFLLGRPDLVPAMLAGAVAAMLLDATMLYRMFDSEVFPARGAWPPGVAAAEAIRAGDEGGRKAVVLGVGLGVGVVGSLFGVPMSGFGVAFIGNAWALGVFGAGLLLRGYEHALLDHPALAWLVPGGDIEGAHVAQGMMLGAGLVALVQVVATIVRRPAKEGAAGDGAAHGSAAGPTPGQLRATLGVGAGVYLLIAAGIAALGGLAEGMDTGMLVLFVVYAAFAALLHELIIGLAGMHSGWFPAFAVAVVSLAVGMLIGFPPPALALLVGFTASTGPAFADMGCDLKAGFLLRGDGADPEYERDGRRQQYLAAMFALVVAALTVLVLYPGYFARGEVAPVDRVFVAAIKAGSSPAVAHALMLWAIPGAVLQALGGSRRQIGIMFATGLLLNSPLAGWAVMAGIACRVAWERWRGEAGRGDMEVFAAGSIAGDALTSFAGSVIRA